MNRKNGTQAPTGVVDEMETLPDLKTALVCAHLSEIRFGVLTGPQVHSWVFKNNGILFRDQDWSRLKKIGAMHVFL